MTTAERIRGQTIRLSHHLGKQVVVEPQDEDRFVMTAQSAVKACQDHRRQEEAIRFFKEQFLVPLIQWCLGHQDKVRACYMPFPQGGIQVFILTKSRRYDFAFGKEIADLELSLADVGWRVSVLQIPASDTEDLQTFFKVEGAIEVYAELTPASGEGGA